MNTQYEENADMISGREGSEGKSAKRSLMEAYPSITWRIRGLSMCRVDDIFDMAAEVRERGGGEMDGQVTGKGWVIKMNPLSTFF